LERGVKNQPDGTWIDMNNDGCTFVDDLGVAKNEAVEKHSSNVLLQIHNENMNRILMHKEIRKQPDSKF
jgi:hypothetical protein